MNIQPSARGVLGYIFAIPALSLTQGRDWRHLNRRPWQKQSSIWKGFTSQWDSWNNLRVHPQNAVPSGLDAAVIFNSQKCKGSFIYRRAYFQPVALRRELYRQTATILDNILDSVIWRMFDIITVLWCGYAVCYGLVNFIIRMRGTCIKRKQGFGCLQLFLAFFTQFDQALNPLSLTKSRFRFQLRDMEAQSSSIEARLSLSHEQMILCYQGWTSWKLKI